MKEISRTSLRKYFAGLAEYAFQTQLGVADPPLTDYISDMLIRFIRSESLFRLRNTKGKQLHEVAEMMAESQSRAGDAKREVHRHIGDFTLFWTGVYPEALKKLRENSRRDSLVNYQAEGKRAYFIVGSMEPNENGKIESSVFIRLSEQFELCAYGLGEVRRLWENGDEDGCPRPFLL